MLLRWFSWLLSTYRKGPPVPSAVKLHPGTSTLRVVDSAGNSYPASLLMLTRDQLGTLMLTFVAGRQTVVLPMLHIDRIELVK